jgi:ParB-like chromosome segregation protein Spo0J
MELQIEQTSITPVVPGAIPEPAAALDQHIATMPEDPANAESAPGPEGGEAMTPTVVEGAATDALTSVPEVPAAAQAEAETDLTPAGSSEPASSVEVYHGELNGTTIPTIAEPPQIDMPVHEAAALFPMMNGDELAKLAEDINNNGLIHPIVTHNGAIVDGRNRYVACRIAGVKAETIEWMKLNKGSMSLLDWIASENVKRRHLTRDQIAIIYAELHGLKELEESRKRKIEAAQQQAAHGKEGGRGKKKPPATNSSQGVSVEAGGAMKPSAPKSNRRDRSGGVRKKIAHEADVSEHVMQQALNVAKSSPELADAVRTGKLPLRKAAEEVAAQSRAETPKPEDGEPKLKTPFNVAEAVNGVVARIDKILDGVGDDDRTRFLCALIEMLEERK